MTKQIIRLDDRQLSRIVMESVKETLRNRLNEDWDDDYGDDGLDDYTNELLRSMEKKDKAAAQKDSEAGNQKINKDFVRSLFNIDMGSLFDYDIPDEAEEEEDDEVQGANAGGSNNELFKSAMEAMETTNGTISFDEWLDGFGGETNRAEAKTAFDAAKKEYESYDEEDASEFGDREMNASDSTTQNQEHKVGNVLEYDGVKITDDGRQFTMVAKENDPQITIKGSNLEEVERTYDRLWNNYSNMEQLARSIGYTVYHGAWLLAKDYDKFVRAAGAHEENLPVLIDLDKDSDSWVEKYRQPNGRYQITQYQLNQLSDEQRKQWERLARTSPYKFSIYSKSTNKINKGQQ